MVKEEEEEALLLPPLLPSPLLTNKYVKFLPKVIELGSLDYHTHLLECYPNNNFLIH